MRTFVLLLLLAGLAGNALAQRELDTMFGEGGYVALGFQPVDGAANDYALAACPLPSGSLVVTGLASSARRVVTAWLRPDGQLDTNYSGDGKESFPVPPTYEFYARYGICHPNGRIYLAYEAVDTEGEGNLHVVGIDASTGLPLAGFGTAGVSIIDLDATVGGLGKIEEPTQLAAGPDGSVLVTGTYQLADESFHGHVLRVSATTGVAEDRHLSHGSPHPMRLFAAIAAAADDTLWAVGKEHGTAGMTVLQLRTDSLEYLGTLQSSIGNDLTPLAARSIDGNRLLIAAARGTTPVLATVSVTGRSVVSLPDTGVALRRATLAPLGGTRHIAAWQLDSGNNEQILFARPVVASTGRVSIDARFGQNGTDHFSFGPDCVRMPYLARLTMWNGHPTVAGRIARTCDSSTDRDYLVVRLNRHFVFADGLE